jgi:hypothetical protein
MLPLSNPSKSDQPQLKLHDTTSFHREDINIVEDNKDQKILSQSFIFNQLTIIYNNNTLQMKKRFG